MISCVFKDEDIGWAGEMQLDELGEYKSHFPFHFSCNSPDMNTWLPCSKMCLSLEFLYVVCSAKPFVSNVAPEGDPNYYLYVCTRA